MTILAQYVLYESFDSCEQHFSCELMSLVASEWTEMFAYDFRDDRMMKQLRDITQRILISFPELRKDINNLSYNLVTKVRACEVWFRKQGLVSQGWMDGFVD